MTKKLTPEAIEKMKAGKRAMMAKRRAMTGPERAKATMDAYFERMMKEFLDACLGKGAFVDLDPKTRAGFLVKYMEYQLGRPNTGKPISEEKDEEKPGLTFS